MISDCLVVVVQTTRRREGRGAGGFEGGTGGSGGGDGKVANGGGDGEALGATVGLCAGWHAPADVRKNEGTGGRDGGVREAG